MKAEEKIFYWDDSEIKFGIAEFVIGKGGFDRLTVYDRSVQTNHAIKKTEPYFDFCGNMPNGVYCTHAKLHAKNMDDAKREVEQRYIEQCRKIAAKYRKYAEEYDEKVSMLEEALRN